MSPGTGEASSNDTTVISRAASSHFGLLATLIAFLVVAVKALSVARFAPATALAVLEHAGPISVFLGALLVGFPIFLMITAILIFVVERMLAIRLRFLYAPLGGIGLIAVPWIDFVLLAVLIAVLVIAAAERDSPDKRSVIQKRIDAWFTRNNRGNHLLLGLTTLLTLVFFTSGQPWVPLESLTVAGRDLTGYVISDESEWTHLLVAETRQMHRIRSDDIEQRQVCSNQEAEPDVRPSIAGVWGAKQKPVIQFLSIEGAESAPYPSCGT